jgi:ATP-dependent RNA helicase DDX21
MTHYQADSINWSTTNPCWIQAGLDPRVIDCFSGKGIRTFTTVQGEAFTPIMSGRDVICDWPFSNWNREMLAFWLADITKEKGTRDEHGRMRKGCNLSVVILCPTRELVRQVSEELEVVARPLGLFVEVFYGGVSYGPQAGALRNDVAVVVGTPGRIMDHMRRGSLNLSEANFVVLDEADEMLNMGFAEDVEVILEDIGVDNDAKTQCLLFSATTPPWVKQIGAKYQRNVYAIDVTGDEGGARVASTVRHLAVQVPPGVNSKRSILEDIIAVEISKNAGKKSPQVDATNALAVAAAEKKKKSSGAMQQKIFGKTIVFTQTKREADELVSGGVFKSLTAQALHGDVGQKQRDATLNAFRAGAFNVLVATDVAARG